MVDGSSGEGVSSAGTTEEPSEVGVTDMRTSKPLPRDAKKETQGKVKKK